MLSLVIRAREGQLGMEDIDFLASRNFPFIWGDKMYTGVLHLLSTFLLHFSLLHPNG